MLFAGAATCYRYSEIIPNTINVALHAYSVEANSATEAQDIIMKDFYQRYPGYVNHQAVVIPVEVEKPYQLSK
jgi:hypothetical protein